ncbi:MAG: hypothetical protein PV358_04915 [Acidimicrobiales bacterium]|nr:hypothetical protein [Acidimicrobiales bacterium]
MREDDDPQGGEAQGSLADGLGQTPGETPSATDAYGDDNIDDGAYGDGADDGDGDGDTTGDDDTTGPADTADDADSGDDLDPDVAALPDDPSGAHASALAQDASPLEGIGFLLDELHDALFGDDEGAASEFGPDPAELTTGTDLDLTGDGVVDGADLREAEDPFDFGVDHHHGASGHDGGVIDA